MNFLQVISDQIIHYQVKWNMIIVENYFSAVTYPSAKLLILSIIWFPDSVFILFLALALCSYTAFYKSAPSIQLPTHWTF